MLVGVLVGLFYSFAYMEESCEHRLAKAGYPRATAKRLRDEENAEAETEIRERYLARYRN